MKNEIYEKGGFLYTLTRVNYEKWSPSKRSFYWGSGTMLINDSGQWIYSEVFTGINKARVQIKKDGFSKYKTVE